MNEDMILRRLQTMCDESSLRQAAKKLGVSAPYLSDILLGHRAPGPKVLRKLGIKRTVERVVSYQPTNGR